MKTEIELIGENLLGYLHHSTAEEVGNYLYDADIQTTSEMVGILAILKELAVSTQEHANDEADEGFIFRSEEAQKRAAQYQEAFEAVLNVIYPNRDKP